MSQCGAESSGLSHYIEMYGPLAHKGMDIGQTVVEKARNGDFESIWPTLLAKDGEDNGITAGFLVSACGVFPNPNQPRNDTDVEDLYSGYEAHGVPIEDAITGFERSTKNKLSFTFEIVETIDQIPEGLKDAPETQGWSLPGVLIHYTKK